MSFRLSVSYRYNNTRLDPLLVRKLSDSLRVLAACCMRTQSLTVLSLQAEYLMMGVSRTVFTFPTSPAPSYSSAVILFKNTQFRFCQDSINLKHLNYFQNLDFLITDLVWRRRTRISLLVSRQGRPVEVVQSIFMMKK